MGTLHHLPPRIKRIVIEPRETLESIARRAVDEPTDQNCEMFTEALNACQLTYYGDVRNLKGEK